MRPASQGSSGVPTIAEVRALDLSTLYAAELTARAELDTVEDAMASYHRSMGYLFAEWHGPAAEAAPAAVESNESTGRTLITELGTKIREMGTAASSLSSARARVLDLVETARARDFDVDEDTGTVQSHRTVGPGPQGQATAYDYTVEANDLQHEIHAALVQFANIDSEAATMLGGSPDITAARERAIIAEVDAGNIAHPLAALQLPWQVFTRKGREFLSAWVQQNYGSIQSWLKTGHAINLPPSKYGYVFALNEQPSPFLKIAYAVSVAAGTGATGFMLSGSRNGRPSLVGILDNGSTSASIDDKGWTTRAVESTKEGTGSLGLHFDSDGPWLVANHSQTFDRSTVSETVEVRPDLPPEITPLDMAKQTQHWLDQQWQSAGSNPNLVSRYSQQVGIGLAGTIIIAAVIAASPAGL